MNTEHPYQIKDLLEEAASEASALAGEGPERILSYSRTPHSENLYRGNSELPDPHRVGETTEVKFRDGSGTLWTIEKEEP